MSVMMHEDSSSECAEVGSRCHQRKFLSALHILRLTLARLSPPDAWRHESLISSSSPREPSDGTQLGADTFAAALVAAWGLPQAKWPSRHIKGPGLDGANPSRVAAQHV